MRIIMLALVLAAAIAGNSHAFASDLPASDPSASGTPAQNCAKYFPIAAIRMNIEGTVVLTFTVGTDGLARDIHVTSTSGDNMLDQAAIACVYDTRYAPLLTKGKPVEGLKAARIAWILNGPKSPNPLDFMFIAQKPVRKNNSPLVCENFSIPAGPQRSISKAATLLYRVNPDGQVDDLFMGQSSGDTSFDAMAMQCVSTFAYTPATVRGAPLGHDWSAQIRWGPLSQSLLDIEGAEQAQDSGHDSFDRGYFGSSTEGETTLSFDVEKGGVVDNVQVLQPSTSEKFDQYAIQTVKKWTYIAPKLEDPNLNIPQTTKFFWRNGHIFAMASFLWRRPRDNDPLKQTPKGE